MSEPEIPAIPSSAKPIWDPDNKVNQRDWYDWQQAMDRAARKEQRRVRLTSVNGVEMDGSGSITLTPDDLGAEPAWGVDTWSGNGTLELADMRKSWEVEGSATIAVPSDATADIPIGYAADFYQVDDGETVEFAAGSGATLLSFEGRVEVAGQNAGATVRKVAANTWRLEGRLA